MVQIVETTDFSPLAALYHASGLEVTPTDSAPEGTFKLWRCEDSETGALLAGATLQRTAGCFILKHLAVTEKLRGTGLGETLLDMVEREARNRGADEMWLVGKVPSFYLRYGWEKVSREDAPFPSKCLVCRQYGVDCFPSVMRKRL